MALTIAQFTTFVVIVPTVTNPDIGIRTGYHVTNTSRAGEGMCTIHSPSVFGENVGTSSFEIAVLSGSFVAGDSLTFSPSGSCVINTVTTATHAGIQVTGTMSDTDSTLNTNEALDATEREITVGTDATAVFKVGQILRIADTVDEYVLIDKVHSATEIWVRRGLFGTGGTHTTGKDIYIVDTDLFEQILDADVTGAWGYSTTSNGRIELDCRILFGKTDQSSIPLFISSQENVDIGGTATNFITTFGNASYRTHLEFGVGDLGDITDELDGVAMYGSIVRGIEGNILLTNPYTTAYMFDASFNIDTTFYGALEGKNYSYNASAPVFAHRSGETSKAINTYVNMVSPNFISDELDSRNMVVYGGSYYLVISTNDSDITGLITDERFLGDGFVSNQDKKFRDSKCEAYIYTIFLGYNTDFYGYKSFNCNVKDELGNDIEGATIKCNYRLASTANIFSVATDSDGDITPQQVLFLYATLVGGGFGPGIAVVTETRDIEYFISKSGYKTVSGRINLQDRSDPICVNAVLEANRYIEQKSK